MDNYTTNEKEKLKKLLFNWDETSNEWFCDAFENEMGVYRDSYDMSWVLRERKWQDEDCEFKDVYEHFTNFDELVEYLR
jgi:hypothetical protein